MFFQNVGWLLTNYMALYPRRWCFSIGILVSSQTTNNLYFTRGHFKLQGLFHTITCILFDSSVNFRFVFYRLETHQDNGVQLQYSRIIHMEPHACHLSWQYIGTCQAVCSALTTRTARVVATSYNFVTSRLQSKPTKGVFTTAFQN
jgi:hypothetical protein